MQAKTMKRLLLTIAAIAAITTAQAEKIVFMSQWTAQAQFAGYYMAQAKGFFAKEGLEVEIRHIGAHSTKNTATMLEKGEVNIASLKLMQAMEENSKGEKLVNILQLSQNSGLMCVGTKKLGGIEDLKGLRIGCWKTSTNHTTNIINNSYNLNIEWIPFINGTNLFVYEAVDATMCYSSNEYIQLYLAKGSIPEENVLRFSELGYNYPEDGLYVTESYYNAHRTTIEKFVRACKRGWDYAAKHEKETIAITMQQVAADKIVSNKTHQTLMLRETLRLQTNKATNKRDYAPVTKELFERINQALLDNNIIEHAVSYEQMFRQ